jgi:hypothetical protein
MMNWTSAKPVVTDFRVTSTRTLTIHDFDSSSSLVPDPSHCLVEERVEPNPVPSRNEAVAGRNLRLLRNFWA